MKICINGFWGGFIENTDPTKFSFFQDLLETCLNEKIEIGNREDSDILLESVFGNESYLHNKKWKYTFFFNGESQQRIITDHFKNDKNRLYQIPQFDCILTGKNTNKSINVVNLPLFIPYIYSNHYLNSLYNPPKREIIPQKNICAVISNSNCQKRNYFLDKLQEVISIDYAGNYRNNVPKIPGAYNSNEILQFYSDYKFVICLENTKQETYITEKIINGFLATTIPIYWGSDHICDYFNEERFIHIPLLSETVIHQKIQHILSILNDNEKYLEMVNKPILKDGILPRNINHVANDIKHVLSLS